MASRRKPSPRASSGSASKTKRKRTRSGLRGAESRATLRLYCHGIGDCHLLKFTKDDGRDFWILIDCGIHTSISGGRETIDRIVDDIKGATERLDVIVATHEHWDHISGFSTAEEKFKTFDVGEVWMAWTEDPGDPQAKALDKFKGQALAALQGATQRLTAMQGVNANLSAIRDGLEAVLDFNFGLKGERVRAARDALVRLPSRKIRYLEPKAPPIDVPGLPNLRVYVMGPPRDAALLGIPERASEMYGLGRGAGWSLASALSGAFEAGDGTSSEDFASPFDHSVGLELSDLLDEIRISASATLKPRSATGRDQSVATPEERIRDILRDHYLGPPTERKPDRAAPSSVSTGQSWRRIDDDWLGVAADLAMQLDSRTNNTSLVLAFEFIDTGRVLLFAADAQVGNWLSWQDVKWTVGQKSVTGPDLLARTVFYKVGHHGSHNATLKAKGLELMKDRDLSAFIPTNEKDAKKVKWNEMPFEEICTALEQQTSGRVIRADDEWIGTENIGVNFQLPSGSILGLRHEKGLWIELDVG